MRYCSNLTQVELPQGLLGIGHQAFSGCSGLQEITIPDTVKKISDYAFHGCSGLTRLELGSVQTVEECAFAGCSSLKQILLPDTLELLGADCITGGQMRDSVSIGKGLQQLELNSFGGNTYRSLTVHPENPSYTADDRGVLYTKDMTTLLIAPRSLEGSYTVPEGVTEISENAFRYCEGLTEVILPRSLTGIGANAFECCYGLSHVGFSEGLRTIGENAFYDCDSLTEVTLPDSLQRLETAAFSSCGMKIIHFGAGLTAIGDRAFEFCSSLESMVIPLGVKELTPDTFTGCGRLRGIWVESGHQHLANDDNGLLYTRDRAMLIRAPEGEQGQISIPERVVCIAEKALYNCDELTGVTLNEGLVLVKDNAFRDACALKQLILPDSVAELGKNAFHYCSGLTTVKLGQGLKELGDGCFTNCYQLKAISIPDHVQRMGKNVFENCYALTGIDLGSSLTEIGQGAFRQCRVLKKVTFPASIKKLGGGIFSQCTELKEVVFLGDAPRFNYDTFARANLVAWYPAHNETWTEDVRQNYSGTVSWIGDHGIDLQIQPATCTEDGKMWGYCESCEEELLFPLIASGHNYESTVIYATCTEQGYALFTCKNCGDSYTTAHTPPIGHWFLYTTTVEPTCTTGGGEASYCMNCNQNIIENPVPALGHSYENGICTRCREPDPSATALYGSVKSSGAAGPVTLTLIPEQGEPRMLTVTEGSYRFEAVLPGSYTLTLTQKDHTDRSYQVTVQTGENMLDVQLCLKGDITGDGKITVADVSRVYAHTKKSVSLTDYTFRIADVTGDGKITVADVSRIYAHTKKTASLW